MVTTQEILKAAVALSDSERVELIEALLASFDPSVSEPDVAVAWRKVASQRAAELDSGAVPTVSWDEVRQEGERRIDDRSSNGPAPRRS